MDSNYTSNRAQLLSPCKGLLKKQGSYLGQCKEQWFKRSLDKTIQDCFEMYTCECTCTSSTHVPDLPFKGTGRKTCGIYEWCALHGSWYCNTCLLEPLNVIPPLAHWKVDVHVHLLIRINWRSITRERSSVHWSNVCYKCKLRLYVCKVQNRTKEKQHQWMRLRQKAVTKRSWKTMPVLSYENSSPWQIRSLSK